MPHIIADKIDLPSKTCSLVADGGFEILFFANGFDGAIGVKTPRAKFILRKFPHEKGVILKCDKSTRPPFLNDIKKAMLVVAEICGAKIYEKNYENDPILHDREYENFVSASEFINLFDCAKKLWIEIGFGSGRHILKNAAENPEKLHLGIEIHRPSAEQLLNRAKYENLNNIVVVLADARTFIKSLKTSLAERIFVHFPAPWDKNADRKVFNMEFVKESLKVLAKNGKIELRTDSENYFENSLNIAEGFENITIEKKINKETIISSKYEDRWKKLNRNIFDLIITKNYDEDSVNSKMDFSIKNSDILREKISAKFTVKDENYLLITKKVWKLNNNAILAQIIMGALNSPIAIYLLIGDQAEYFPSPPLPTKENFAAHLALIG
ncbi:MAG: tRNA (guanosine(46)-N7)-methyltransferase TrmB [Helicobacteraceae bacterium]|jgi:tRNA (guanine-N7-)-methyltransferase|nr:tRNA (guanosine(46)-N7)-methyltransferase TrmB [Helicobacteraceae bacterium]